MSDSGSGQPRMVDTQIIPVVSRPDPRGTGRGQSNDDRTGRLVLFGLVFSVAFLVVAAALWWASGARNTDALANRASPVAPVTAPATVVADSDPAEAASTLPLSPYPLPAQGMVMSDAPQTVPPAAVATQPTAPPATEPVLAAPATLAETTTTTTSTTTTTVAPTTTFARPTTTLAAAAPAPATTSTTTSTTSSTSTSSTTTPATTVPGPVVTSPASADATLLDVVNDTPDLSRVRELVEFSGFAAELEAARPLTFLAPSNAAVDSWAATPDGQVVLADPDAVYDLLLRHLVPDALDEATIFTRPSLDTVSGAQLVVREQSHTVGGADLLVTDVKAANGYLDVTSDVLT